MKVEQITFAAILDLPNGETKTVTCSWPAGFEHFMKVREQKDFNERFGDAVWVVLEHKIRKVIAEETDGS